MDTLQPRNTADNQSERWSVPPSLYELGFGTAAQFLVRQTRADGQYLGIFTRESPLRLAVPILAPMVERYDESVSRLPHVVPLGDCSWPGRVPLLVLEGESTALVDPHNLFPLAYRQWDAHQFTQLIRDTLFQSVKVCESTESPIEEELERLLFWLAAVRTQNNQQQREWKHGTGHYGAIQHLAKMRLFFQNVSNGSAVTVPPHGRLTRLINQLQSNARALMTHLEESEVELRKLATSVDVPHLVARMDAEISREPESRKLTSLREVEAQAQRLTAQPKLAAEASAKNRKKRFADQKARAIQLMEEECLRIQQSPAGATRKRLLNHVQESIDVSSRTVEGWFKRGEIAELIDRVGKRPPEKQG